MISLGVKGTVIHSTQRLIYLGARFNYILMTIFTHLYLDILRKRSKDPNSLFDRELSDKKEVEVQF